MGLGHQGFAYKPEYPPVHPYNFKVELEGLQYAVRNRAGLRTAPPTGYEEIAIQEAFDSLRSGRKSREKVLLLGEFPDVAGGNNFPTGCLEVSAYTEVELNGFIKLADQVNKHLLVNAHPETHDPACLIHGGIWDGNYTQQTGTVHLIYWEHSTTPASEDSHPVEFRNMEHEHVRNNALHVDSYGCLSGGFRFARLKDRWVNGYGLYLNYVVDSFIDHCLPLDGSLRALYANWCGFIFGDVLYLNQGVEFVDSYGMFMDDCFCDVPSTKHGMELRGCWRSQFGTVKVRCGSGTTQDHDAVSMSSTVSHHCIHNEFGNMELGRIGLTGEGRWNYGIEEVNVNQDYNTYGLINGLDCVTGAIRMLGVNSRPTAGNEHLIQGTVVRV